MYGLKICRIFGTGVKAILRNNLLEGGLGRQLAYVGQYGHIMRRQCGIVVPSQIGVHLHTAYGIVASLRQTHNRYDEAAHRGAADNQRILSHDVETVVAAFVLEQYACGTGAVDIAAIENHDVAV